MNNIEFKKVSFDTSKFIIGYPYLLTFSNGCKYVASLKSANPDQLTFNCFTIGGERKQIYVVPTINIEISEFNLSYYNNENLSSEINIPTPEMHKPKVDLISKEDVPVEPIESSDKKDDLPDEEMFYIRTENMKKYPLFVKDGDDLIINYNVLEPYLSKSRKDIMIGIACGIGRSCGYAVFEPKDVRVHVGGSTITGEVYNKKRDTLKIIEVRADEIEHIKYAHVKIIYRDMIEGKY